MAKDKKSKKVNGIQLLTPEVPEVMPVFTCVDTAVHGTGLRYYGYLNRQRAIECARKHYQRKIAEAHAALEAIEQNQVWVRYMRGIEEVDGNNARGKTSPPRTGTG